MTHDELVEKMCEAWDQHPGNNINSPRLVRMSAALAVAVEEMFPRCTQGVEVARALPLRASDGNSAPVNRTFDWFEVCNIVHGVIMAHRSLYLKPKTVEEERIVIEGCGFTRQQFTVRNLDSGIYSCPFDRREDAETYRIGLIKQLKEQSK